MDNDDLVVVTGAGGFIGGHLVGELIKQGCERIRAVDVKPIEDWFQVYRDADNLVLDLREKEASRRAADGARALFNFAADMGGMGFIETHKADCMISVLINTHLLMAARDVGTERYFFASSACIYNVDKQSVTDVEPLKEEDAYPAMAEDGYGWEKLFGERMCRHFAEDYGIGARIARYHNVYGPHGTWDGGREKAPAAICRKVAAAKIFGSRDIEIWGDGEQTRSFTWIDDCTHGTLALMGSDHAEPINIGSSELVTINQMVDIVEEIAGLKLRRHYTPEAPQGVRGRNSDNRRILEVLGWEPRTPLQVGLERTYRWIFDEMSREQSRRTA